MSEHTCKFSRPNYTCPNCGLFVAEYLDDLLARYVNIENSAHRLRTRLALAEAAYIASDEYIDALILAECNPEHRDIFRNARVKASARHMAKEAYNAEKKK